MGKMNTEQREIPFKFLVMSRPLHSLDFPGGSEVKNLCASAGNAGDAGWIPGWGEGNPHRYSCLENPMRPGRPQAMGGKLVGHNLATKWQQSNNCLLYISEKIGKWKCLTPMAFLKGPCSYCLDFGFINHILSIQTQKKSEKVWKGKMFHGLIDLIPEW